jgi:hypothetical protein
MKKCSCCNQEKEEFEFTNRKIAKDGLNSSCRECTKLRTKKHYKCNKKYYRDKAQKRQIRIKEYIHSIKGKSKCSNCEEKDIVCLDFHHINRDKDIEIAKIPNMGWSIERVNKELNKCKILCANCHRKLHRDLDYNTGINPLATNQSKG